MKRFTILFASVLAIVGVAGKWWQADNKFGIVDGVANEATLEAVARASLSDFTIVPAEGNSWTYYYFKADAHADADDSTHSCTEDDPCRFTSTARAILENEPYPWIWWEGTFDDEWNSGLPYQGCTNTDTKNFCAVNAAWKLAEGQVNRDPWVLQAVAPGDSDAVISYTADSYGGWGGLYGLTCKGIIWDAPGDAFDCVAVNDYGTLDIGFFQCEDWVGSSGGNINCLTGHDNLDLVPMKDTAGMHLWNFDITGGDPDNTTLDFNQEPYGGAYNGLVFNGKCTIDHSGLANGRDQACFALGGGTHTVVNVEFTANNTRENAIAIGANNSAKEARFYGARLHINNYKVDNSFSSGSNNGFAFQVENVDTQNRLQTRYVELYQVTVAESGHFMSIATGDNSGTGAGDGLTGRQNPVTVKGRGLLIDGMEDENFFDVQGGYDNGRRSKGCRQPVSVDFEGIYQIPATQDFFSTRNRLDTGTVVYDTPAEVAADASAVAQRCQNFFVNNSAATEGASDLQWESDINYVGKAKTCHADRVCATLEVEPYEVPAEDLVPWPAIFQGESIRKFAFEGGTPGAPRFNLANPQ